MSYAADRVRDTSTTTGTGTVTVSGAPASTFVSFASQFGVGDAVPYCVVHQSANEFEVGRAVWLTGTTFSRSAADVTAGSSGVGVLVNFSAGTKDVFSPLIAEDFASVGIGIALQSGGGY